MSERIVCPQSIVDQEWELLRMNGYELSNFVVWVLLIVLVSQFTWQLLLNRLVIIVSSFSHCCFYCCSSSNCLFVYLFSDPAQHPEPAAQVPVRSVCVGCFIPSLPAYLKHRPLPTTTRQQPSQKRTTQQRKPTASARQKRSGHTTASAAAAATANATKG